jgi:hypothetical protein
MGKPLRCGVLGYSQRSELAPDRRRRHVAGSPDRVMVLIRFEASAVLGATLLNLRSRGAERAVANRGIESGRVYR